MMNFWLFFTIQSLLAIPYERENTEVSSKWSDERLEYFRVMQRLGQMMRKVNQPKGSRVWNFNKFSDQKYNILNFSIVCYFVFAPQTEPERSERRFSASDGRLRRQENDTLLVSDFESDEYYYYYDDNGLGRGKKKKKKTQEIFLFYENHSNEKFTGRAQIENFGPIWDFGGGSSRLAKITLCYFLHFI